MDSTHFLLLLAIVLSANCVPITKRDEGSKCVNVYNECPEWKTAGFCTQHPDYMQSTCPVTCGFCKETVNEVEDEEDNGSSEAVEEASGASGDDLSGVKKSNKDEENGSETKNAEDDKEENKKYGDQAAEKERTENAEKYEDEEKEDKKDAKKPVKQKKKNLMETMLDNGELQAVSVAKGKARQKVPVHANKENEDDGEDEQEEEEEEDATNIDLNFKDTGLEQFSGSGSDDDKLHLTLRQNFDKKYEDKNAPAFKILSGNFEKDMGEALGDDEAITDVSFSEAEVEGNPRTAGKVRVNFKFNGDYNKLQKLVKSGSINGLLVLKNSLEGPMLNLEESK